MSDSQSLGSPGAPMAQSPGGYISEDSPVHSPCQFSPPPQHSPYHNPHSPQNSPYHDGSQPDSPYHEHVYNQPNFNHPTSYRQPMNNLSVNCSQNKMAANSSMVSPNYQNHQMTARNPSMPMTIPNQEGRCNQPSHGSWSGMPKEPLSPQTPSFSHSHPSCPVTIPTQERGFRQNSPYHSQKRFVSFENLQRINQYFLTSLHCSEACLELLEDEDLDGCLTRNDIEKEVVYKTLNSVNPTESYHYVLTGECSSDGNCSSSSLDEFTSCRRQNKRKYCDDSDISEPSRCEAGVHVGRYKRQVTEKYWRESSLGIDCFPMTNEKQAVLEHLSSTYRQLAEKCSKTKNTSCMTQGGNHNCGDEGRQQWEQIQMRIVKNTAAAVKFASQIPGFSRLHPEDKTFLCKNVTFMNTLLLAGHHQYNPTEKSFQEFWNWPINPQNPFYPFKQSLLQMGERIHGANMDVYEVSALAALLFLATDFLDLIYPEAIEDARNKIISALQSYELSKGTDAKSRLAQLFDLVPEIRHIGMWHTEMMKQMKVNIQVQEVHQLFHNVSL